MESIPKHLAVIIDGNRRWAKKRGLSSFAGHKKGFDNTIKIGEHCLDKGIKILTFYCFSTENWNRPKKEVNYLMKLLSSGLDKYIKKCVERKIKIKITGQKERLSKKLQEKIKRAEEATKENGKGILNLLISYGGRTEIVQAAQKIKGKITEEKINNNLWTAGLPAPDLIIRTGGEKRLSNFLTWQSVYSELYFTDKFWPAFTKKDLDKAFEDYASRSRRFGK